MVPRAVQQTATIFHLGVANGAQDYSASADETIQCGFFPLSAHRRLTLGGDETYTNHMYVDDNADVREGDKVIINSVQFRAEHVDLHDYGGHPHKDVILARVKA